MMVVPIDDQFMNFRLFITSFSLFCYGSLFMFIYVQLWLVIKYEYKKWCYRTYVLFISIIWCSLRITLFSYYCLMEYRSLSGKAEPSVLSRHVGFISYFLLYSSPLYLQFTSLCFMTAYFHQLYRSSRSTFHPSELEVWKWPSVLLLVMNIALLVVNFISSVVIKSQEDTSGGMGPLQSTDLLLTATDSLPIITLYIVHARVLINGFLFICVVCGLTLLTYKVANTREARLLLETENLTKRSAILVCFGLVSLCVTRTVVNIMALVPAVSFVLDTDQIDLLSDSHSAYYMLVAVLFLFEFSPTVLMVVFFRVKAPSLSLQGPLFSNQLLSDNFSVNSADGTNYSFLHAGSNFADNSSTYDIPSSYLPVDSSPVVGSVDEGVHSLSSRFSHRTSLFSYCLLNGGRRC